jgi:hypothetical protein
LRAGIPCGRRNAANWLRPLAVANETDMLMRNTNAGTFEVYDISNNTITSAAPMGQVGLEWSVAGIAADPPGSAGAANSQLVQAMASYAPSAAPALASGASVPIAAQIEQASPLTAAPRPS